MFADDMALAPEAAVPQSPFRRFVSDYCESKLAVGALVVFAAIVFVATLPSIGAVYLLNAGIAAVGPARMGIFNYLQPLFVAAIAIPFLGERLSWYHPIALALVARGIVISSRGRGRARPPGG